ncbi:MAG: GTP-binding protein, partial [Eubacteriales bacterium]|nr:GTP-binding protein [Eubacteriales bacterium]
DCHDHEHHHHHHDDEECDCHDHEHHHHHDEHCGCGHHHHHHDADEVFTSWGKETIHKFTKEQITAIMEKLSDEENAYGMILRAKGMVEGENGTWIYFDMVPGEADVREGSPEYTGRLCVIGSELKEDKLAELFGLA